MARARRQPPLFEFLGGPDRRPTPSAVASPSARAAAPEPPLRKPVEVAAPRQSGPDLGAPRPIGSPKGLQAKARQRTWLFWGGFGIAGVALLGLVVWNLAYRSGRLDEQAKLRNFVSPDPANPTGANPDPTPPVKVLPAPSGTEIAGNPSDSVPASAPEPPAAPLVNADVRRSGVNYLELATLTYRDAMQAVEFLSKNGLKAAMAPSQRGVDAAKAAANNAPHVVFLSEGVPSDRFRASEGERQRLETRVEQVGKRYQRELKGPTDFSRPMWRLFREKDKD